MQEFSIACETRNWKIHKFLTTIASTNYWRYHIEGRKLKGVQSHAFASLLVIIKVATSGGLSLLDISVHQEGNDQGYNGEQWNAYPKSNHQAHVRC